MDPAQEESCFRGLSQSSHSLGFRLLLRDASFHQSVPVVLVMRV